MMLKKRVIKITVAAVALAAYLIGSLVCVFGNVEYRTSDISEIIGFFFWEESGVLCLLNTFVWIAAVFFIGTSVVGCFGVLPVIYYKMYSLSLSVTAVILLKGQDGMTFLLALIPEILLLFFVLTEAGSSAVSFSLYILQKLSLLPKKKEQTLVPEEESFGKYISGGVIAFFFATILVVYENIIMVLVF